MLSSSSVEAAEASQAALSSLTMTCGGEGTEALIVCLSNVRSSDAYSEQVQGEGVSKDSK